jgi:hypothetical protein
MFEGWSCAEWNVAASDVADTLESDRLCQLVSEVEGILILS